VRGQEAYRGTSIIRNSLPLGPYGRPMPRPMVILGGGGGLMSEVPLYSNARSPTPLVRWSYVHTHRPTVGSYGAVDLKFE